MVLPFRKDRKGHHAGSNQTQGTQSSFSFNFFPSLPIFSGIRVLKLRTFVFLFSSQTESALVYDSVKLLAMALENLDMSQSVDIPSVSCEDEIPWSHGTSLVNYMRPVRSSLLSLSLSLVSNFLLLSLSQFLSHSISPLFLNVLNISLLSLSNTRKKKHFSPP